MEATKINLLDLTQALPKSTRAIVNIFVHCTAGVQNESNADLLKGFKDRGWKSPGYHVTVDADGTAWCLQHPSLIANGVQGYNQYALHISYKGGVEQHNDKLVAVDNRTDAQKATLLKVLEHWRSQYPKAKIQGHRDVSPDLNHNGKIDSWEYIKQCPCFDAILEYKSLV